MTGPARPILDALPTRPTTRFAPAPTGFLHVGHLANAIYVWGLAAATDGRVLLRIEDHDRGRCRPEYEAALLDELDWLGFRPDEPSTDDLRAGPSPFRQSEAGSTILRPDGAKLSKADADTSIRDLRAAGASPADLIGRAAAAVGLLDSHQPVAAREVADLFR